jgi:predicted metal-binding protein
MKAPDRVEIMVCIRCRPAGAPADEPRAGLALFEAVQEEALAQDTAFAVLAVECMRACKRSCAVALQSLGKTTYLFGHLSPDKQTASQIVLCAQLYQTSRDGAMPRAARPDRLREGILARLPPPTSAVKQLLFSTQGTSP